MMRTDTVLVLRVAITARGGLLPCCARIHVYLLVYHDVVHELFYWYCCRHYSAPSGLWDADTSRCKKAKHAQQYTLRPINSHLYLFHVKHSMALYNVQGVSARHRAGQKAREGDAGLTCGGA